MADEGQDEAAESFFQRGLETARRQETLAWELRCATSLGRLMVDRGKPQGVVEVIGPVVDKFTEGFGTTDLQEVKALLEELGDKRPDTTRR